MPEIKILPHGIRITVQQGKTLSEALHQAGIPLEAACGGQGTCGRCAVEILEGRCEWPGSDRPRAAPVQDGCVLSCQATVIEDVVIRVPETTEISRGDVTLRPLPEAEMAIQADLTPLSGKRVIEIAEMSREKGSSDFERLASQISEGEELPCSLSVLRSLPRVLRHNGARVTATVAEGQGGKRMIKLEPGIKLDRHYGVACDIGTTTVSLKVVDLNTGRVIDAVSAYNDQIECGADVISRIIYAQKKGRLQELTRRVMGTVNGLLGAVLPMHGISPDEVTSAAFSGNTTMVHLLLGIDPKYIREDPYVPAVKSPPLFAAEDLGVHIHPQAPVFFSPAVGSYVGGDITAGVLCTRLKRKSDGVELFIDIGTNGELVISGENWTIGCACSAGPAFEGTGIKCGMRASKGAIETVDFKKESSDIVYRVAGGGRPRGICGSGLIELVAGLFASGAIGRDGKFNEGRKNDRIRRKEDHLAFIVAEARQTATEEEIYIGEGDIVNIMRAKAAIFSACSLLLKNVGLSFSDIEKVYIAGGFGNYLNIEKAITIGLFPDIDPSRFEYLGNTSLLGAYLALLSCDHRNKLKKIATSMTYVDLSSEPDYMNEFTGALFLPHTDETLFPTVKRETKT